MFERIPTCRHNKRPLWLWGRFNGSTDVPRDVIPGKQRKRRRIFPNHHANLYLFNTFHGFLNDSESSRHVSMATRNLPCFLFSTNCKETVQNDIFGKSKITYSRSHAVTALTKINYSTHHSCFLMNVAILRDPKTTWKSLQIITILIRLLYTSILVYTGFEEFVSCRNFTVANWGWTPMLIE